MTETLVLKWLFSVEFPSFEKKPHFSSKIPLFTERSRFRNVNEDFKWTNSI